MSGLFSTNDHVILCGYGETAVVIASDLAAESVPVVAVDKSAERMAIAETDGHLALLGDVLDPETLKEAGTERARGIILLLPAESDNLFATMTARELNPDIFIIARHTSRHAASKLLRAGADRAVNPFEETGRPIGSEFVRPAVMDLMRIFARETESGSEVRVREITIESGSGLLGKSLREANIRAEFDTIVIAMRKEGDSTRFNPDPDRPFESGDIIVCMGRLDSLKVLHDLGRGVLDE
ncbi:MAG: TrkA family potassium uptake protein [Planctomycetota bacterium]|nr:TrkA family potassium uptake protein [Planctomycetota bacterium]